MPDPVTLKSGLVLPAFGVGTWKLGEDRSREAEEVAALVHAIEVGFTHLDTAEMYGEGDTETLMARALAEVPREAVQITSKVYPWNASRQGIVAACEGSLSRLGVEWLDLYLLHWPGSVPFEETLEGAMALREAGKIRAFGISNFDARALGALIDAGLADEIEVNQVMYNPARRGIEYDLLPLMVEHQIACIAYTPIEPARMAQSASFAELAAEHGLAAAQLALAWHVTHWRAIPIPKASSVAHVDELRRAVDTVLRRDVMDRIDAVFPPPNGPRPLDIL